MNKTFKTIEETIADIKDGAVIGIGGFFGELGNPSNFTDPKQIVKYEGYDPQEHDSGQRTSRKIISKKDHWLLRKYLYFMAMRAVHRNLLFKEEKALCIFYSQRHKFYRGIDLHARKTYLCLLILKEPL